MGGNDWGQWCLQRWPGLKNKNTECLERKTFCFHQVISFDGKTELDFWESEECNRLVTSCHLLPTSCHLLTCCHHLCQFYVITWHSVLTSHFHPSPPAFTCHLVTFSLSSPDHQLTFASKDPSDLWSNLQFYTFHCHFSSSATKHFVLQDPWDGRQHFPPRRWKEWNFVPV